jgi:hypothetical protein
MYIDTAGNYGQSGKHDRPEQLAILRHTHVQLKTVSLAISIQNSPFTLKLETENCGSDSVVK